MKRAGLLVLAVTLCANCAGGTSSQANRNAIQTVAPTTASVTPANVGGEAVKEPEREKEVPAGFRDVDFKNFSYPIGELLRNARLKDGHYEYENWEENSFYTLDFKGVDFADVTGDGKKEAIVQLVGVGAGVSSDGGSNLFFFYSPRRNKPVLFWALDTGSLAYGCGLKSFVLKGRKITVEVYRKCRFRGESFEREPDPKELGKYDARSFTRFVLEFDGGKFVQRQRKVFPYDGRTLNSTEISISDD
jgi:hypothetical protein